MKPVKRCLSFGLGGPGRKAGGHFFRLDPGGRDCAAEASMNNRFLRTG
ncbi:hypothetical protein C7S15_5856 [Burkholderia cepacia]|nr:hypothetical protein [Burkholderia cepacia]